MTRSVAELREAYQEAVQDNKKAQLLWESLESYIGLAGPILAYKASARALLAKDDWNPYNKLAWVKEAMDIFQKAIRLEPENIEIRFLRFAIQHHSPEFLQLSGNLKRDKQVILSRLHQYKEFELEVQHLKQFHKFFVESERFTADELKEMESFIEDQS